jgi:hypothetical protein
MTNLSDPAFLEAFKRAHRTATAFGGAILAVLAVYLIVEEVVRAVFRPFAGFASLNEEAGLRYALYAAAVAAVVLLRLVHGALLRPRKSQEPAAALRNLVRASVVVLALAEAPAAIGLALFLLGGYNRDFYILLFVSLVLAFMYFPRRRAWEATLQNSRASCPY